MATTNLSLEIARVNAEAERGCQGCNRALRVFVRHGELRRLQYPF
jgi:hypothetical protein